MESEVILKCQESPAMWPLYKRALFSKRRGMRTGEEIPSLYVEWVGAAPDKKQLAGYRAVCGIKPDGFLPILYPQVLTGGLQLTVMSSPKFPLRLLGLVHQRNRVLQHRPIGEKEKLDFYCKTGETRVVKQGLEFDMITAASVQGERVWEAKSTYLSRGRYGEAGEPAPGSRLPDLENPTEEAGWNVARGMGRRYARVSGDYNPIHISWILARVFGFKRTIIHGMWSAAAAVAQLPGYAPKGAVRYDVAFKGPIFTGSSVTMKIGQQCGGNRFDLF